MIHVRGMLFVLGVTSFLVLGMGVSSATAQGWEINGPERGNRMIREYFHSATLALENQSHTHVATIDEWTNKREDLQGQLLEMLGLSPWPEKTELNAEVTSIVEMDDWVVEQIHFQSRPGLYVTGNLYRPKVVSEPLPAILYVCGHGAVKQDGVSYGNKVHYQHHGAWFARNGYVCLTIDSLQLGEIEGIHHGTYRYDMWWWLNRGYTPAGVEAWNCVRALDYLESRPEVDATRFGVTGRSGGGAYSWWIAAIDERIQCAVPVAGITDLTNHVIDGCVEGHCDCMYFVNTYQWDYATLAAMVAPRPLLISNTDRDRIFPLDGVVRTHANVKQIYELYDVTDNLALHITAGPHQDTQELRIHAFRWFNHHLKGDDSLIEIAAEKHFEPEQLQVFAPGESEPRLPPDSINAEIHETFVPRFESVAAPDSDADWQEFRDSAYDHLTTRVFRGWPNDSSTPSIELGFDVTRDGLRLRAFDFQSQDGIPLRLFVAQNASHEAPDLVVLNVLDEANWLEFVATYATQFADVMPPNDGLQTNEEAYKNTVQMLSQMPWAMAYVAPRGIGLTAWNPEPAKHTQIRRRFYLLGQSLDGMRVFDTLQSIRAMTRVPGLRSSRKWAQSEGSMAAIVLHASLFAEDLERLDLHDLPTTHREGPFLLNVSRMLEVPQLVALAAARSQVMIYSNQPDDWSFANQTKTQLGWDDDQVQIREALNSSDR